MLKIDTLQLNSNLILAPMSGISDLPFRMLNRGFGAELAFVEMLNCRSLSHKSRRTRQMLASVKADSPLGAQILGCEAKYILKAMDVLKAYRFEVIDFNAACPAKKVVRRAEGAALMRQPKKLQSLLKLVVRESNVPVTVKIRSGWDKGSVNAVEVACRCADAGASAVFIHGRTKQQGYSGAVDYAAIAAVKKALSIPVVASGDVLSPQLVKRMFSETGCDAVAIARGALGNPWIFKGVTPDQAELIRVMRGHLQANVDFYGERMGVMKFRKFFNWYTKGLRHIRPLREKSSRAKTQEEIFALIEASSFADNRKSPPVSRGPL
jgi:tRNA-dihydrouridine synthase B